MLIHMRQDATLKNIAVVINKLNEVGVSSSVTRSGGRTLIGLPDAKPEQIEPLHNLPGIEQIKKTEQPFKLVSRDFHPESSLIKVKNAFIGGGAFCVMAGPCSIESEEQLFTTAQYCKNNGATILRGGAYKPRTSPYSFQGLGVTGLRLLAEAGRVFNMPVITEILSHEHIEDVVRYADILQVGTRNMQNFKLLEAVGKAGKPVMLKRGMNATLKEFLLAAEYIFAHGSSQVILCERGIRSFDTFTRNTLDIAIVPAIKQLSHLPVIVDPSHAAGRRDLILPLSKASLAAGADGLMIETHPKPDEAMSDGDQSLTPEEFQATMEKLSVFFQNVN